MFPLHFLYLVLTTKHSSRGLWTGLLIAMRRQLSDTSNELPVDHTPSFPWGPFMRLVSWLTVGITLPSLLWFIAVSLAPCVYLRLMFFESEELTYVFRSITDVTALWNTNAFFAYVIQVRLLHLEWDTQRLGAVILATVGAAAVIYGGSNSPRQDQSTASERSSSLPSAPLIGDLLTLCASVGYGLYQVLYNVYVSLPSDAEVESGQYYTPVIDSDDHDTEDASSANPLLTDSDVVYPPPFALYPNLLTSAIGLYTLLILWIPLVILHILDVVPLVLPPDNATGLLIAAISLSGAVFNSGFMV